MEQQREKVHNNLVQTKTKAARFCAYQERSCKETRKRLLEWGLSEENAAWVIAELIRDDFLNEERFAYTYSMGKFRIKKWGALKIINGLKQHGVNHFCQKKALGEINLSEYLETLQEIAKKKWNNLTKMPSIQTKKKLFDYLVSRGFEAEHISHVLMQLK